MNTSDTPAAHEPLWNACRDLASTVTSMHPHAAKVADEAARGEILKALFEITRNVEIVKKQLQRAERRDESRLL